VFDEAPGLDQRLSELQGQIDRLTVSLQLWRDGQERIAPADARLADFADQATSLLDEWNALGDRHAHVVDALEQQVASFGLAEGRLQHQSAERFLALERMVHQEWATLRQVQLEPGHGRRDRVVELTEACVAAAAAPRTTSAADEAPARGEVELQRHLAAVLSRPAPAPLSAPEPVEPSVATIRPPTPRHPGLRPHLAAAPIAVAEDAAASTAVVLELSRLRADLGGRLSTLQLRLEAADRRDQERRAMQRQVTRRFSAVMAVLLVMLAGGAWWVVSLQQQLAEATMAQSAGRTQLARADAAVQAAAGAQAIGAVLAAPDLMRYALTSATATPMSAQLLWSRSRGLVFSAARLAPVAPDSTYQVWLLSGDEAVSAGLLAPDVAGRATLVAPEPPPLPGAVTGVSITLERAGGSTVPSGRIVALQRLVRPPA